MCSGLTDANSTASYQLCSVAPFYISVKERHGPEKSSSLTSANNFQELLDFTASLSLLYPLPFYYGHTFSFSGYIFLLFPLLSNSTIHFAITAQSLLEICQNICYVLRRNSTSEWYTRACVAVVSLLCFAVQCDQEIHLIFSGACPEWAPRHLLVSCHVCWNHTSSRGLDTLQM